MIKIKNNNNHYYINPARNKLCNFATHLQQQYSTIKTDKYDNIITDVCKNTHIKPLNLCIFAQPKHTTCNKKRQSASALAFLVITYFKN